MTNISKQSEHTAGIHDQTNSDSPTNATAPGSSESTYKSNTPFTEATKVPGPGCAVCAKLGRTLKCCQSGPCETCAIFVQVLEHHRLNIQQWEEHCNALNKQILSLHEYSQRQIATQNDVIAELEQDLFISQDLWGDEKEAHSVMQNILAKKEEEHASQVEVLLEKTYALKDTLQTIQNRFVSDVEKHEKMIKEKDQQAMAEHFEKHTCMPRGTWEPFLDRNNERVQGLNADIRLPSQKAQEKDEYIAKLGDRIQVLREATGQPIQEEDDRIKSLTIQLQALRAKNDSLEQEHNDNLAKLKEKLVVMQNTLAQEEQNHKEANDRLTKNQNLDIHQKTYEAHLDEIKTHIREQTKKREQELHKKHQQELTDATQSFDQQLKFQQEKLDQANQHLNSLQDQLFAIHHKKDRKVQEESDYIESLKQQYQEAEEEGKRLSKLLEERKAVLARLQSEQAQLPSEFVIKEAKNKKGKGKGKEKKEVDVLIEEVGEIRTWAGD
ncbi:hypothetical protein T440DRAFT_537297 [Plenodomus tracheiphilus IPT5]|uniref:Uncharacterized protein n=1 Tax=Plenodomus tracheiphilus IPT5 TaxID=1408161 RepID=A0A6A7AY53_9PLEO|nr:hypothetical protein T440DRAFT_537297 [Plenodomus tracheiphilus IPT5]